MSLNRNHFIKNEVTVARSKQSALDCIKKDYISKWTENSSRLFWIIPYVCFTLFRVLCISIWQSLMRVTNFETWSYFEPQLNVQRNARCYAWPAAKQSTADCGAHNSQNCTRERKHATNFFPNRGSQTFSWCRFTCSTVSMFSNKQRFLSLHCDKETIGPKKFDNAVVLGFFRISFTLHVDFYR